MTNSIKPKKWEFFTRYQPECSKEQWLPGVNFTTLFKQITDAGIKYLKITFEEVVDWDRAPMRKFFHGVVVPAFEVKYNETCSHPENKHFHNSEIKDFLKAKFVGWDKDNPNWDKWAKVLGLDQPIKDMFSFIEIQKLNRTINPPIEVASSENLLPVEYMKLINKCEAYYFELFQCTYDIREKPDEI